MANNPQYTSGPGPRPRPPMVGSVTPLQNIPPPMAAQFRPLASFHPPQQFAPPAPQQYSSLGPGIPAMNLGIPSSQNQQMQFAPPIQPASSRLVPQGQLLQMSQSMLLTSAPSIRPMTSGLPQSGQDLGAQSSFLSTSDGLLNAHPSSQYPPLPQIHLLNNPVAAPPIVASGIQGTVSFTPVHQTGQPLPSVSPIEEAVSQPKPSEQSSDWIEHVNSGRRFYYNKKTRQSTWEKPLELMTPIERADATTNWKEYLSLDGRKYYYNKVTKLSKWTIPEELKLAREQADKASSTIQFNGNDNTHVSNALSAVRTPSKSDNNVVHSSPTAITPAPGSATSPVSSSPVSASLPPTEPVGQMDSGQAQSPAENPSATAPSVPVTVESQATSTGTAVFLVNGSAEEGVEPLQNAMVQEAEDSNKITSSSVKINAVVQEEKAIGNGNPTFASKEEAKGAFIDLLEAVNVGLDWTWEQTMRLIINDKRYVALKSLGEKKHAFNEYLSQKKKQEAEERRVRNKKAREEYKKMLEECRELRSTTRWGKAQSMLGSDERFKAIERARDREDMFEDYLVELGEKEREKEEEDRLSNIMEYRKFLESCDFIKGNSQWRKVKERLEVDERCSRLEVMDRLTVFQEYVGDLDKQEEEQRRLHKEELRKAERRNRDEFRKLMEEHVSDGTLTAKTNWREYHSKVKDLPVYVAVSSNSSGSTPKELFEDVVEELKKQYQEDKTRIKDAVKSEKVVLSLTWTVEDLKAAIVNGLSSPEVSETNLKLVFDELLERAREKEEKEAKRRKRVGDEFFNMLCSVKEISIDSQWEDSLPLFQAREEFRSMGDEDFSKQIFEEFLEQLKEKEKELDRKRKEEKAKKEKERERDKRSKDRREKDRRHDRDRGRERSGKYEEEADPYLNEVSISGENRRSSKDRDRKHRKRHEDEESDSFHRHSSELKKSRHMELHDESPGSDNESRHKKNKREHRNGSRRKGDNEELEDGELGDW